MTEKMSPEEMLEALEELEAKGLVFSVRDEVDGERRWFPVGYIPEFRKDN